MVYTEKLEVKKVYSYKELCCLFEEAEKTSNSRDAQKKEWACYFRWSHPSKQKYMIEEIYDTPLPKKDRRENNGGNSTSKYLTLDDIIIDYFDEHGEVSCTIPTLAVEIGLLTEQYAKYKNNTRQFSEDKGIPEELVGSYLNCIQSCVLDDIKSALKRLEKSQHLDVNKYMSLVLLGGGIVRLSSDKASKVVSLENEVLAAMNISRLQLYKDTHYKEYCQRVNRLIHERLGYETSYHYWEYHITRTKEHYTHRGKDDAWRLTRKFITTIGLAMLKTVCYLDTEYAKDALLENIIDISNAFFTYMTYETWDKFWNEEELNWKNENKAMLFWSQYCLAKSYIDARQRDAAKQAADKTQREKRLLREDYRTHAIEELGKENVEDYERILPDLDWIQATNSEDYATLCVDALNEYYDIKDKMCYCKNEPVEEYGLYLARMMFQGKEDAIIPLWVFEEQCKPIPL